MRKRQASIADNMMESNALLDGRYRLDTPVRRSATTTIHLATHRNGSTAWLKMPLAAAHAEQIALEARIANTIGSPLVVRDDGTTPEGMPYLILDPPTAESVKDLRTRGRAGARMPLARVMTAGDALARVVASIHAIGHVTAGLEDEDVLVFDNADVALLDLHAIGPLNAAGVAADVGHVKRVLGELIEDVAEPHPARATVDAMLTGSYPDVAALQAAWRASSPEPIVTPIRMRSGSFADLPPSSSPAFSSPSSPGISSPAISAHDTPLALSVGNEHEPDGSMIGYLRTAKMPSIVPSRPRERAVMYDPLSKVADVSRLVQAASRAQEPPPRRGRGIAVLAALVAIPVLIIGVGTSFALSSQPSATPHVAAAAELSPTALPTSVNIVAPSVVATAAAAPAIIDELPATPAPAPNAANGAPVDDLELTMTLKTANAPPGRAVFLDGAPIGKTPLEASVPCGTHTLQMVAGASKQVVDLPCGGERVVRYDAKGHWALALK